MWTDGWLLFCLSGGRWAGVNVSRGPVNWSPTIKSTTKKKRTKKTHKKPAAARLDAQWKSAYSGLAAVDSWSVTSAAPAQRTLLHPDIQETPSLHPAHWELHPAWGISWTSCFTCRASLASHHIRFITKTAFFFFFFILCFRLTSTSSRMRSFWCCHQPSSRLRKNRRRCPRKVTSEFCRPEEISCLSCQAGNRRKARSYVSNIGLLLTLRRLVPFSHEGDLWISATAHMLSQR